MSPNDPSPPPRLLRSFGTAFRGLGALVSTQLNARIHLAATVLVCALGFAFGLSRAEWSLLVAAIAIVWVAEGLNTALEFLADAVKPDYDPLVGKAKDVAAGAVLAAAIGAAAIGLLVLGPHLLGLLG